MANLLQRSLKVRVFMVFFLMAAIAVSVLGVVTFFAGRIIIKKQVENALVSVSQSKEATLIGLMSKDKVAFNLIQDDRWLTENVERILNNDPDSRQVASGISAHLKDFVKYIPNVDEIFVMDMKGEVVVSSEEARVGDNKVDDPFFIEGLQGLYFKSVYHSKSTNQISWGISGPFLNLDRKKEIGVIALRFSAAGLQKVLGERAGLGETGESYLVNRDGIMISESRFNADVLLKQKVDTEPVRLWQRSGKQMQGVYKDYRNHPVLGASMGDDLAKEADMGWVILTEMDVAEAFAPINQLGLTIIILGLVISILVGFAAFLIAQGIANPIALIAQVARRVGEGDLTQNVAETNAQDEIGNLTTGFRNMITGLRTILLKVQEATGQITASGTEILAASQEQASAAREQSSAVAETTSAAKELSTTSESVGESIKKVAQVASHAMAGMAKIKESIDKTNGMLNSLGEKSQKIGKITDLIDDVADQTNLLAVNASIEAARAGEQGRGFTVVADEIRKLADSTAKSTKDITSLIELIQHEMSNAIMSMEQSIQSVDEEARLAQQTTEKTKEIAMSTHQQISGAKQIAEAMMNIDETMKQVAAGAQQSQVAVKQLTSLAGELNHLASKFKL